VNIRSCTRATGELQGSNQNRLHSTPQQQRGVVQPLHPRFRTRAIDFSSRWSSAAFVRTSAAWRESPDSKVFFDLDAMDLCTITAGLRTTCVGTLPHYPAEPEFKGHANRSKIENGGTYVVKRAWGPPRAPGELEERLDIAHRLRVSAPPRQRGEGGRA